MSTSSDTRYVVFNTRTHRPVAMDMPSGGYPYDVDSLWDAKFFDSREGAMNWAKIVWTFGPYTVYSLKVSMKIERYEG